MKNNILYSLAVLLGLSACSSDIDTTDAGTAKVPVTVNATIGSPFTRTTPLDDETAFATGDKISVSNGDESKTYTLATDGTWSTDGDDISAVQLATTTFEAYYPVKDGNSYEYGKVETDQNMTDLSQSDFMTASTPLNLSESHTLNLSFERKTAKVTVNITRFLDEVAEEDRHISSVQIGANTNVGDKAATNVGAITMKEVEGTETQQFVALVGPTTQADLQGQSNLHFLTLNFESGRAPLYATTIPTTLASGNSYTFNVTVGGDKLKVDDVTVTDFAEGEREVGTAKINNNLDLGTLDSQSLLDWLNTHNLPNGSVLTLRGPWKNDYFSALQQFTNNRRDANLTVDLSKVTGLTSIPESALAGWYGMSDLKLPLNVTSIGNLAFHYSNLKSLDIPEGLTRISSEAFIYSKIEKLYLPSTYTSVGNEVFGYMRELTEIHFKGNMQSFGYFTFRDSPKLQSIYLDNCTQVPSLNLDPFYNDDIKNITVYVKEDMLDKFKNSAWGRQGVNIAVAP